MSLVIVPHSFVVLEVDLHSCKCVKMILSNRKILLNRYGNGKFQV